MKNCDLVKSCERVRDLGEVFTPARIVKSMCNLIPKNIWNQVDATFLEPSCGTGNFLAEILQRKLKKTKSIQDKIIALQSIYGVDIMQDNVDECRCRLLEIMRQKAGLAGKAIEEILDTNIICGNTLTMKDCNGKWIKFKDWKTGEYETLKNMLTPQQSLFDLKV